MTQSGAVYAVLLVALTAGVAGLLAGEFFHGVKYLVYVGGALALLAVAGITAAIARVEPSEDAAGGH
ncbi:MAG: hypothetical protein ABEH83_01965 [Halobacterium sp.]